MNELQRKERGVINKRRGRSSSEGTGDEEKTPKLMRKRETGEKERVKKEEEKREGKRGREQKKEER